MKSTGLWKKVNYDKYSSLNVVSQIQLFYSGLLSWAALVERSRFFPGATLSDPSSHTKQFFRSHGKDGPIYKPL